MNTADTQYISLVNNILQNGRFRKSRAGDSIGIFGAQLRFDLAAGFPLLTTKKVHFKGIVHELLWFLSGSTNIKYLVDNDVHIWDDNCYDNYCKKINSTTTTPKRDYVHQIKIDEIFAKEYGNLGEGTYGGMWRKFPVIPDYGSAKVEVDQISKIIESLKNNPDSRRHIVNAWHPYWVDNCALPPCHVLFQFHTETLSNEERWKIGTQYGAFKGALDSVMDKMGVPKYRLNCQLYQRSCDVPLGGPYNIASYSLLTHMVAQVVNMVPGDFVWSIGDAHIYMNQIEAIKEQILRKPKSLPKLILNSQVNDIFAFKYEDIVLENYDPHPAIKIPFSV